VAHPHCALTLRAKGQGHQVIKYAATRLIQLHIFLDNAALYLSSLVPRVNSSLQK